MVAAINRGQDYMKASNNMALVPANGTFELANTVSMTYRCVRSTIPTGRHLVIHPLPADLCPMIISDSHWLLENLLCLTSNAIKYSDSGDINLIVTMEPTSTIIKDRVQQKVSTQDLATITSRPVLEPGVMMSSYKRHHSMSSNHLHGNLTSDILPVMHRSFVYHLTILQHNIFSHFCYIF